MAFRTQLLILVLSAAAVAALACSSSVVPCVPKPEVCNGTDDDCDGVTDDHLTDVTGAPCGSDVGACKSGHEACIGGKIVCDGAVGPTSEVCNGIDDDCNGQIDDSLVACGCTGGAAPKPEVCNGIDDDCNGQIDDGLTACGCTGGKPPKTEVCNGIDDDCNGIIDDLPNCGCTGGKAPTAEVCNGIDDNCNGQIDEGYVPDASCGVGYCRTHNTPSACTNGVETPCTPGSPLGATDATCDGVDDNCNGQVDEDYVIDPSCGVGYCRTHNTPSKCINGVETPCVPGSPLSATDATCDGVDDNCNNQVDEDYTVDASCGVGYCRTHNTPSKCSNGVVTPCVAASPLTTTDATCDGVDDNCNGRVDEDYVIDASCGVGYCHTHNTPSKCTNGVETPCAPGSPLGGTDATCDGVDDDCDGAIDDDVNPPSACACSNVPESQIPAIKASPEVCNGIDDNCNGLIDDLPKCGCTGGVPPKPEVCNGIDDDCNGLIDDLPKCGCTGGAAPKPEVCNGIDDNCNGQIDEDNGSGKPCGGFGDPCTSLADCSSQICVGDMFARYCSQTCDHTDPSSCPNGYRCYIGPNGDYCKRDYPPCQSDSQCPNGQVCTVQDSDDGLSKVEECRPALSGGAAPGSDCSATACRNDLCTWINLCTELCSPTAPCQNQYLGLPTVCVLQSFYVNPGQCGRDAQCPTGYTCQTNQCIGPTCTQDTDCATGYNCPASKVCTPNPSWDYLGTCEIGCGGDDDCPTGMACQVSVLADLSKVQGTCSDLYTGNPTGFTCTPCPCQQALYCDHGIRFNNCYCSQLCTDATDCPFGMNCTPGILYTAQGPFPNTMTCTNP